MLQGKIFNQIAAQYKHSGKMIEDLQSLLNLSRASVYKRLNTNVLLDIRETEILIQHYQLNPLELFQHNQDWLTFEFPAFRRRGELGGNYLSQLVKELEVIDKQAGAKLQYLSTDLPVFYYFLSRDVARFKLFVFQHTIWQTNAGPSQNLNFELAVNGTEDFPLFERLKHLYGGIDSEEVWNNRSFEITISQIKYSLESGYFTNPRDAVRLVDKLISMVDKLEKMVHAGNKAIMLDGADNPGKLTLLYNDFGRFSSTILTFPKTHGSVYLTYDLPNYLKCNDPEFMEYTAKWIDKIKLNSYPLTQNADKERRKFFNRIKLYLTKERNVVEQLIED